MRLMALMGVVIMNGACKHIGQDATSADGMVTNRIQYHSCFFSAGTTNVEHAYAIYGEEVWAGDRLITRRMIENGAVVFQETYSNRFLSRIDAVTSWYAADGTILTNTVQRIPFDSITQSGRERELRRSQDNAAKWLGIDTSDAKTND